MHKKLAIVVCLIAAVSLIGTAQSHGERVSPTGTIHTVSLQALMNRTNRLP
jgi:hypothetical protein